jgi:very-short-patch-repair endonuclease
MYLNKKQIIFFKEIRMGNIFRCTRCNEIIWLTYYKLPDKTALCWQCGDKEKEQEKQQKMKDIKQKLTGDAYHVFYKFVEKYRGTPPTEELQKLISLLELKYLIHVDRDTYKEIEQIFKTKIENQERIQHLEEFEKDLLETTEYVHKKVDALTTKNGTTSYFCTICNNIIDKKNFEYTKTHFGKPLCEQHQGTPYQRKLFEALRQRGIGCEYEAYDGFKHVDIAIPKAKLYIEIDGKHHLTDPTQLDKDLWRDEYSSKDGYRTIHYSNEQLAENLPAIADALAEVIKNRENNIIY